MSAEQGTDEKVAAGGFILLLGAMLGGLGIIAAALAVATERAWSGRDGTAWGEGSSLRRSIDDHRRWLAEDREWRRAQRRSANPAYGPKRARFGRGMRRLLAWVAIGAARDYNTGRRFREGLSVGAANAREAQQRGSQPFRDAWRGRHGGDPQSVVDEPQPVLTDAPGPAAPITEPSVEPATPTSGVPYREAELPPPTLPDPQPAPQPEELPTASTNQQDTEQPQEEPMPALDDRKRTSSAAQATPGGETHLDFTLIDLDAARKTLTEVEDYNDQMAARRDSLLAQAQAIQERAESQGGTTATIRAADELRATAALIGELVARLADATTDAGEKVEMAEQGLRPAQNAQDEIQSAGGRGDFIATAHSD